MPFGSARQQRSGKWRADYPDPLHKGKRLPTSPSTFTTQSAARKALRAVEVDIERGVWKHPDQIEAERLEAERAAREASRTFGDYAASWFETRAVSKSTQDADLSRLRTHLLPKWKDTPLRQITTPDIRVWIAGELSPNRPGARKKSFELFKSIMATAEDDGVIERTPVKRNMLGTVKGQQGESMRHAPRALSAAELIALADEVPDHMRTMILLMGTVGLRVGEARELRAKDLDLKAGTLNISRAVTGDGKALNVGKPKTEAGDREVQLPPAVADLLKTHMAGVMRGKEALIFPSTRDPKRHMGLRTIQLNVKAACKRAGIPHTSPHDLRHTAASLAGRVNGISPKDVQAMLGQATPGMALRYTHTDTEHQQRIAKTVGMEVFGESSQGDVTSLDERRTGTDR